MTDFRDAYDRAGEAERKQARKDLEASVRAQLTRLYGRVWTKGKIAVRASKMVEDSMRAGKAAQN